MCSFHKEDQKMICDRIARQRTKKPALKSGERDEEKPCGKPQGTEAENEKM